ncbi:MAG: STN domain-containing protein [Ferruginibacter sp.]
MKQLRHCCFVIIILSAANICRAQNLLDRTISIQVNKQRLDNVLEIISNKANFYFSYNSAIIKKDSIVTFNYTGKTIRAVLNSLFDGTYEFKESGNYIIIRKAPIRLTVVTKKAEVKDKIYSVAGYVYDEQSGMGINEASVYEKNILASAFTNNAGYFKLKLKSSKAKFAALTVSKEFYKDASLNIEPNVNQEVTITLMPEENPATTITVAPEDYITPDTLRTGDTVPKKIMINADTVKVEKLGLSKFFLSAKQKIQSLNLKNFFTTRPFQASLTPKLSSHGYMSAQVVNNFSLNVFGGYTAGTNGAEIGGLFNIDKKAVQYFQAAGLFNAVGGRVKGFQVAGLSNIVLDTVQGFQAAGINNIVKGKFHGFQVGGVYNHVTDSVRGFQAAGVGNFANKKVTGLQIAGVANFSRRETDGVQIAGVFNYSKKLRGVQFGLINIADSSSGYSIGLINIVLKGYHKLSFSTNELLNVNVAFKTGNPKFYSILTAGLHTGVNNKAYSYGYGLGSERFLDKNKSLSLNPEITCQYLYLGSWDYTNLYNKLACRRSSPSSTSTRRAIRCRRSSARLRPRGPARRGAVVRAGADGTRARRVHRRRGRLRRLHGRRRGGTAHRRRRAAHRRGGAPAPHRGRCRGRVHRAAPRPAGHAGARAAGQELHRRGASTAPAKERCRSCSRRRPRCPRRPSSRPPACGSLASSCERLARRTGTRPHARPTSSSTPRRAASRRSTPSSPSTRAAAPTPHVASRRATSRTATHRRSGSSCSSRRPVRRCTCSCTAATGRRSVLRTRCSRRPSCSPPVARSPRSTTRSPRRPRSARSSTSASPPSSAWSASCVPRTSRCRAARPVPISPRTSRCERRSASTGSCC